MTVSQDGFQKPAIGQQLLQPTRVILTGKRSAFIGPNLIIEAFRTAVATIVIGLDQDISVRWIEDNDEQDDHHPVVIISPGILCELQAKGEIAILFCDALCDDVFKINLESIDRNITSVRAHLKQRPQARSLEQFIEYVFTKLGVTSGQTTRPEIVRVVRALGREPERFANVETAAELAGLSSMRFQHVFTETMGLPFRRYRQWRRMGSVIHALADGENLTEAAYGSGFSNSAHLSTAFKAMFGLRPSDFLASKVEYFLYDTSNTET